MSKRFTATDKWDDEWFMNLPLKYKMFYLYVVDKCDNIGIWKPNISLAEFQIKEQIDVVEFKKLMGKDRLYEMPNGAWFLLKFIDFQYGTLSEQSLSKPIQSYIGLLKKHSLWIPYTKGIKTLKEKDKDKEKDKEEDNTEIKKPEWATNFKNYKPDFTYPIQSAKFGEVWDLWMEYKTQKKQKYVPLGEQGAITHLCNLADNKMIMAEKLVNYAISHNWDGIYLPKGEDKNKIDSEQVKRLDFSLPTPTK